MTTVLVLTGSLRAASITTQIAAVALNSPPPGVSTVPAHHLDALPFYNQDFDTPEPPAPVASLRAQVTAADAVLFVTPETTAASPPSSRTPSTGSPAPATTPHYATNPPRC